MQSVRLITCRTCNGAGNLRRNGRVVRCEACGGRGQLEETFESHVQRGGHCALVLVGILMTLTSIGGLVAAGSM